MADVTVDTITVESVTQDSNIIEPVTVEDATPSVQDQKEDEAMIVDEVVTNDGENADKQIDHPPVTNTGVDSDVEIVADNTDLVKKEQPESEQKTETEFDKELEAELAGLDAEEFGVRLSKEEKRKRELEMNEIRAQREPLAQITVNIGPVMLDDLNTPSLREVLKSSSKYTVTFEMDTKKKNKERKTFELIGQIKIPYAFRSQRYLVKMYELLSKLRIGNRDLSVSFPPEFVAVVEKSKKLIEELAKEARERRQMKKQLQIQANADAKKKSLYVHNLPTSVKEETLKTLFEECTNVVIPKTSEGMNMGFAVLEFKDVETAEKCYYGSKKKELEVHRRRIHLSRISVSGAPTDDEDGAKNAGEPRNKPVSNQKEKEKEKEKEKDKDQPSSPNSKDQDDKDEKDDEDKSETQEGGLTPNQLRNRKRAQQRARARQNQRKGGGPGRMDRGRQNSQNQSEKRTRSQSGGGNRKRFRRGSFGDSQNQNQGGRNWGGGGNSRRSSLLGSTVDASAEIAFLKNKLAAMQDQLSQTGGHDRGYDATSGSMDYGYYPSGGGSGGGYRGGSQQRGYGSNMSGGGYYGNRGASRSSSGRGDIYSDYIKGLEKGGQQYPY